jgi:oligopeptide/dipeptide ABC transporter ATP-binding protein
MSDTPLLEARDVRVTFASREGRVHALDGVSFAVSAGETVGLVGESGSGKSTLALALMRAIRPDSGSIRFAGEEIGDLSAAALKPVRRRLQMVFQDPYASLDPRMRVGAILAEPLRAHDFGDRIRCRARVAELLQQVGLPPEAAERYPSQFSGGQRQRIAIARALTLHPEMIIADEPVSSLDVSIQAQIVNLMRDIQQATGIAYLLIAHDLALVHEISDRIVVMYLGRVVEEGTTQAVVRGARHPYTVALLTATPTTDPAGRRQRIVLRGDPPSPIHRPGGCAFHPRCPIARDRCAREEPRLEPAEGGGRVACFFPGELESPVGAADTDPSVS